jgi:hypothetical protein
LAVVVMEMEMNAVNSVAGSDITAGSSTVPGNGVADGMIRTDRMVGTPPTGRNDPVNRVARPPPRTPPSLPSNRPAGAGCAENTFRSGLSTGVPHVLNAKNAPRYRTRRFLSRSRRSFRGGSPELAASPAVPNDNTAAAPTRVSPRMAGLIAEYQRCAAALAAIDDAADPIAWEAAEVKCRALEVLLDQRPATMAEFHAKLTVLIPATASDTEFVILRILAEDARLLTEAAT